MDIFQQLQRAIAGSPDHKSRLEGLENEEDAISAIVEIASIEGIPLDRADVEGRLEAARHHSAELSEEELASVSGGFWSGVAFSVAGLGATCAILSIGVAKSMNCGKAIANFPNP